MGTFLVNVMDPLIACINPIGSHVKVDEVISKKTFPQKKIYL